MVVACCAVADPPVLDVVEDGASVRDNTSGSVGRRSFRRTKPEGADFTGTYLLSSMNLMNFSWAGTTLAGFVKISKVASGSGLLSAAGLSTCQLKMEGLVSESLYVQLIEEKL